MPSWRIQPVFTDCVRFLLPPWIPPASNSHQLLAVERGRNHELVESMMGAKILRNLWTLDPPKSYIVVLQSSPIRLPAYNAENLIPLVIIVSMCEVFSPERRCTRHALQKHYTNRQIFKKILIIKFLNNMKWKNVPKMILGYKIHILHKSINTK